METDICLFWCMRNIFYMAKIRPIRYGNAYIFVLLFVRIFYMAKIRPIRYGNVLYVVDVNVEELAKIRPIRYGNWWEHGKTQR